MVPGKSTLTRHLFMYEVIFMIDLHTHTLHSDGADDVLTLLRQAQQKGIEYLSITDHNSVAAYRTPEMKDCGRYFEGKLIFGVEITCMYCGEVVEVLGYGFDLDIMEQQLEQHTLAFEEKQNREFELLCKAFSKAGAVFDKSKVLFDPKKESCRKAFMKGLASHPENDALFSFVKSRESSKSFTRNEIYNPQSRLYVDESELYPDVCTAVKMIHESGGKALLAHLYEYSHAEEFRAQLDDIVSCFSLDGIECAHSSFSAEQISDLEMFCNKRKLLKSGGSDYHGARKPDCEIGIGRGTLCISADYLGNWPAEIVGLHYR